MKINKKKLFIHITLSAFIDVGGTVIMSTDYNFPCTVK